MFLTHSLSHTQYISAAYKCNVICNDIHVDVDIDITKVFEDKVRVYIVKIYEREGKSVENSILE